MGSSMAASTTGQLLDTTVLIDLLRGNADAATFADAVFESGLPLFVSAISAMGLIAGCRSQAEVRQAKKLIATFVVVPLSPSECAKAYTLVVAYSKSHGLSIPDALIAATAITQELQLATDNDRHFQVIPGLSVKRPY
jgi:hypothetical protein